MAKQRNEAAKCIICVYSGQMTGWTLDQYCRRKRMSTSAIRWTHSTDDSSTLREYEQWYQDYVVYKYMTVQDI